MKSCNELNNLLDTESEEKCLEHIAHCKQCLMDQSQDTSPIILPAPGMPDDNAEFWTTHKEEILNRTIRIPWYAELSWFHLSFLGVLCLYLVLGLSQFARTDLSTFLNRCSIILTNQGDITSPVNFIPVYAAFALLGTSFFISSLFEE
jgi:hypothetical protein